MSRKVARCGSTRSNRSLHSVQEIPGDNPNGKLELITPVCGSDAEAGRSPMLSKDGIQTDNIQITTKTSVKQSVLNLLQSGKENNSFSMCLNINLNLYIQR